MFTQTFIAVVLAAISVQGLPQVQNPPVPTPSGIVCAPGQQAYTVLLGDNCFTIAQQFPGATAQSIIQANPTINSGCTNLQPAQVICVPTDGDNLGTGGATPALSNIN
ncbi:carbohydrate-binding module family 50 protein [Macrolepiota fuliginosa MF-IS2]|uniref:Carbohydrate-binding module family 50 protein n=1 Tax=Macrolepiota fuliginosa MF-IS2 TaxID=1400762 RepID=A0A9P5X468_9AGAR|nr:carbohydrate-binding module family 50 protein [Macrolepiota fuliginosa MF-IS2]